MAELPESLSNFGSESDCDDYDEESEFCWTEQALLTRLKRLSFKLSPTARSKTYNRGPAVLELLESLQSNKRE